VRRQPPHNQKTRQHDQPYIELQNLHKTYTL
jgi:hypothetical protein